MSWRLVVRVLKTPMRCQTDKVILALLAERGNEDGRRCFPGVRLLVEETGLTRKNVQLALRRLELQGRIEVVAPARQHRPTEYRIAVERLVAMVAVVRGDGTPGASLPTPLKRPGVSLEASRGVAGCAPEASLPTPDPTTEQTPEPQEIARTPSSTTARGVATDASAVDSDAELEAEYRLQCLIRPGLSERERLEIARRIVATARQAEAADLARR